ncbi:MAG: DUF917 domain-containing protein [Firmicutes bacterium]|nr:DUF917 domain-containing protein [Bacillota bacterium]
MARVQLRTWEDVEDFVYGVSILGTGGGGRPELGLSILRKSLDDGLTLGWDDVDSLPEDSHTACIWYMGSIAPVGKSRAGEFLKFRDKVFPTPLVQAARMLEELTGTKIDGVVALEMGGSNSTAVVDAAARLGVTCVDGDYAGRAVPEIVQIKPAIDGARLVPIAVCDQWGNKVYIVDSPTVEGAEALGKMVSTVTKAPESTTLCGHAGVLLTKADSRKSLAPGTFTRAGRLGKSIREARNAGKDPVEAAASFLGGWAVFAGVVKSMTWESRDGYMYGETHIEGTGRYIGKRCRVWYKNENHGLWVDDRLLATSPDIITILYEDGLPTNNSTLKEGQRVGVVASPNQAFRTEAALAVLGPAHFGLGEKYIPVENLIGV